jgi:hypothetical protein
MNGLVHGGCFCKAVRYEATGTASNSMVCHCRSCRRVAAAPAVAWVTFAAAGFRFTHGTPTQFQSSEAVHRTFCAACGTPLTYVNAKDPGTLDVTTCSLDDPCAFPPTHHSWLSHDLAWVRFGDGLPSYPESRPPG